MYTLSQPIKLSVNYYSIDQIQSVYDVDQDCAVSSAFCLAKAAVLALFLASSSCNSASYYSQMKRLVKFDLILEEEKTYLIFKKLDFCAS